MKFLFFALAVSCAVCSVFAAPQDAAPYQFDLTPEGNFEYSYQADQSQGQAKGIVKDLGGNPPESAQVITGEYSWTSPEGKRITVRYTADENGYHPQVSIA